MSRTKKPKKNGQRTSKAPIDTGTDQLSKRHQLKPEAVDHSSGGVRLRIIDTDTVTKLYHSRVVSEIQYSLGQSFIKDYWRAGLSGKPAQNLEGNSSGGYHNYIPYGVSAMQRFRRAADYIVNKHGPGSLVFLIGCLTTVINIRAADVDTIRGLLDSLENFYQGRSPSQELQKLLRP